MAENSTSPNIAAIAGDDPFSFACHPQLGCFTQCCRMLELALTPYDLLRLRHATGLSSSQLLHRYVIVEQDQGEPFPRLYLTMVDDGYGSCPFVSSSGCAVYTHRPGACRTYPLGRGTSLGAGKCLAERFVLIREEFCQGFSQQAKHTPRSYLDDQETRLYNRSNDRVATILQHEAIRNGLIPTQSARDLFLLLLYDLDTFRERLREGFLAESGCPADDQHPETLSDEELLDYATELLPSLIFPLTKPTMAFRRG